MDRWQRMETEIVGLLGTLREAKLCDASEDNLTPTERHMATDKRRRLLYDACATLATVRKDIRKLIP